MCIRDRTYIVDIDPGAEKRAQEKGHNFICKRIENYVPEIKFDLIIALNLIEHVNKPTELLQSFSCLLKPDGILLIKTPNTDCLDFKILKNYSWAGLHAPRHWVLFNRKSFAQSAAKANLQIKQLNYTQGAYQIAATLSYWLERKFFGENYANKKAVNKKVLFKILLFSFALLEVPRAFFFKTAQMFIILRRQNE